MHRHRLIREMVVMGGAKPWYLAGGVSPDNILGAWQPKNASTYAASKVSLINPSAANLLVDGTGYPTWAADTGWTFSGVTKYLTIASAIATAVPISMVCRFAHANVTDSDTLMAICDTAAANSFYIFAYGGGAGDPITASTTQTTTVSSTTTTGYTANVYYTAAGVFSAVDSRAAYINGGSKGTDVQSRTPSGLDTTYIGIAHDGTSLSTAYTGIISACAFYNIALSDMQVLAVHNALVAAGL